MAEESLALREWLTEEVKLERYFDKLVSHGYVSLLACCSIDENVLDEIAITPPYHRKRLLKYVEDLRKKLADPSQHGPEPGNAGLIESTEYLATEAEVAVDDAGDAGEIDTPPLPPKVSTKIPNLKGSIKPKPEVPARGPSINRKKDETRGSEGEDIGMSQTVNSDCEPRITTRASVRSPPPIPPRADLFEETESGMAGDLVPVNSACAAIEAPKGVSVEATPLVLPEVVKRERPIKPLRRNATKRPGEGGPSCTAQASLPTGGIQANDSATASVVGKGSELTQNVDDQNLYVNSSPVRPAPRPLQRGATYPQPSPRPLVLPTKAEVALPENANNDSSSLYENVRSSQPCNPVKSTSKNQLATVKKPVPKPRVKSTEKLGDRNIESATVDLLPQASPRPLSTIFHSSPEEGQAFLKHLGDRIGSRKLYQTQSLDQGSKIIPVAPCKVTSEDLYETVGKHSTEPSPLYGVVGIPTEQPSKGVFLIFGISGLQKFCIPTCM